ncbi:MAG TPA: pyridoxamine 5'-phosphate oxidase family protein [Acidisphaera sp.]|nr:pyridoxamine 5'-phosphate oxidase family protein [Acidisphaera sp.]
MDGDLGTPDRVRAHYGRPNPRSLLKQLDRIDTHARRFIGLSPFVVIASADADGRADATPRGDAPGFVAVLDERTLLIPDRPGNNRVDTMLNVTANPHVGLLFMVPGIVETLRVNGSARLTSDPTLLAPLAANGKAPSAGLLVSVRDVYFHCGKALIRADLWNPERYVPCTEVPSLGRILADQLKDISVEESERRIADGYVNRLY